jgi:hypothetical protein
MITLPAGSRSFRGSHPTPVAAHQRPSGRSHSTRTDRSTITAPTPTRSRTQISPGIHGATQHPNDHNHSPPPLTPAPVQISEPGTPRETRRLAADAGAARRAPAPRERGEAQRRSAPQPWGRAVRSVALRGAHAPDGRADRPEGRRAQAAAHQRDDAGSAPVSPPGSRRCPRCAQHGRGLEGGAAAFVDPAVRGRARLVHRASPAHGVCGRSAGDHVQRRSRSVFGRPLGAAPPAGVLLAGHRCVQAWHRRGRWRSRMT